MPIEGLSEFNAAMDAWEARVEDASLEFVTKGGQIIADSAKEIFRGGSHDYPWQGPNFPYPTSHSGFLRDSIKPDNIRAFPGGASSETGPQTVYGRRIELGYTGTGQFPYYTTRPFPFLKPGFEKAVPSLTSFSNLVIRETMEV